jgi:hypothetical protein
MEHSLYCCSTSHSRSRVFNRDHNSYPNMCVKRFLDCIWAVLYSLAINATSGYLCHFDLIWCIKFSFPDVVLPTRKLKKEWCNLVCTRNIHLSAFGILQHITQAITSQISCYAMKTQDRPPIQDRKQDLNYIHIFVINVDVTYK